MAGRAPSHDSDESSSMFNIKSKESDRSWKLMATRTKSQESGRNLWAMKTYSGEMRNSSKSVRGRPIIGRVKSALQDRSSSPARAWVRPMTENSKVHTLPGVLGFEECWTEPCSPEGSAKCTHEGQEGLNGESDVCLVLRALAAHQTAHESRIAILLDRHYKRLSNCVEQALHGRVESLRQRADTDVESVEQGESAKQADDDFLASTSSTALTPTVPAKQLVQEPPEEGKVLDEGEVQRTASSYYLRHTQSFDHQMETMDGIKSKLTRTEADSEGDGEGASDERGCLDRLVHSGYFEIASCFLIVVNALTIGLEVDWMIAHPGVDPFAFRIMNLFFLVAFSIELLLRVSASGLHFCSCRNHNIQWNIFDTMMVVTSIVEEVLANLAFDSGADIGALRLFRTLRLVRSFRIIRVFAFFRDLRVMLAGIMSSTRPLFWALVLLLCIMYLLAVCLLQFAGLEFLAKSNDPPGGVLDAEGEEYDLLKKHFQSLFVTIYTLSTTISGGLDWSDAAQPLFALGYPLGLIFCTYIAFSVLCVLNIITGVFVENATKLSSQDEDMVILEQMESRKKWFAGVKALFETADTEHTGFITLPQFRAKMKDVRMLAELRKIGVQVESHTSDGLFALMDFDGNGALNLDEFIEAIQSVNGYARGIDMAKLQREARHLREEVKRILKIVHGLQSCLLGSETSQNSEIMA
eukprot:TRINITY_DN34129_c0_g1_i1.p1 TRINITY_DN34129_c0_g1~~TRINITY_DN34129_c0_g1_i1.p1  ORF type:complete len:695 (+),score=120.51 TRINITY_DN34129_c0_g1_i1:60-2144(+)